MSSMDSTLGLEAITETSREAKSDAVAPSAHTRSSRWQDADESTPAASGASPPARQGGDAKAPASQASAKTSAGPDEGSSASALDAAIPAPAAWVRPCSLAQRVAFDLIAVGLVALIAAMLWAYYVPAHPGVDQNGYLVGGRYFAQGFSTGTTPGDPYQFVGRMWNAGPDNATYYPKYPLGLPVLYALCLWVGSLLSAPDAGVLLAHAVSPVCAVLAAGGCYLLMRPLLGRFGALMGTTLVATSPAFLGLANNPNSHAASLAFVVLGMVLLIYWWMLGGAWRAALAGLLLGYAVTIRYTEGLLLLPMAVAVVDRFVRRARGRVIDPLVMGVAWTIPVGLLVAYNLHHFHALTGYDSTNESTGFGWEYVQANWDNMLRTLTTTLLVVLLPLAMVGLITLWHRSRRWALFLGAWAVPGVGVYTAYYWAPESGSLGYARFFLSVLPPLAMLAVYGLMQAVWRDPSAAPTRWRALTRSAVTPLAVGAIVFTGAGTGASTAGPLIEREMRSSLTVDVIGERARAHLPSGSVIFADQNILHHLQFIEDYRLYEPGMFSNTVLSRMATRDDFDEPHPIQPQRIEILQSVMQGKSDRDYIAAQNNIIHAALAEGRRVAYVGRERDWRAFERRYLIAGRDRAKFTVTRTDTWIEPPAPTESVRSWARSWGGRTPSFDRVVLMQITALPAPTTQPAQ